MSGLNFPIEESVKGMQQDGRDTLSTALEHMQVRDRCVECACVCSISVCVPSATYGGCAHVCVRVCEACLHLRRSCKHTIALASHARSLKMYNNLVERCFRECSEDMRSKTLNSKEEQVRVRSVINV